MKQTAKCSAEMPNRDSHSNCDVENGASQAGNDDGDHQDGEDEDENENERWRSDFVVVKSTTMGRLKPEASPGPGCPRCPDPERLPWILRHRYCSPLVPPRQDSFRSWVDTDTDCSRLGYSKMDTELLRCRTCSTARRGPQLAMVPGDMRSTSLVPCALAKVVRIPSASGIRSVGMWAGGIRRTQAAEGRRLLV